MDASVTAPAARIAWTMREHLGAVVATMRLSSNWHDFYAKLDRNYKRYSGPTQTAFDFSEDDEGKGL